MNIYYLLIGHFSSTFIVSYYLLDLLLIYNNDYKIYYKKNIIKIYLSIIVSLLVTFFTIVMHNIYFLEFTKHFYIIIIFLIIAFTALFKYSVYVSDNDFIDYYNMSINRILSINKNYINKTNNNEIINFIKESDNVNNLTIKDIEKIHNNLQSNLHNNLHNELKNNLQSNLHNELKNNYS
jgi:hypothetical protein